MEKKIIRLDEQQFTELVKESVSQILNEIGYRTASLPHGANYNAAISQITTGDSHAETKIDNSNIIRLDVLSKSINDTFPNLQLVFIERDKANQFYSIKFTFKEMSCIDDEHFVMKGALSISGKTEKTGYIELNFNTQTFYRVNYYASGTIRRIYTLMMNENYKSVFKSFLTYITNFCCPEKDYEHIVDTQGSTFSKEHQPH